MKKFLVIAIVSISATSARTQILPEKYAPAPIIANTTFDNVTNVSEPNRIYRFSDGTIGSVTTGSLEYSAAFSDRGTFYNYYNGTGWGPIPTGRIETVRTGWPSYAPLGANGEIIISHQSGSKPLIICKRDTKGTGTWIQSELGPPNGASGMLWPRVVTSGTDHTTIHLIAVTTPVSNGGLLYNNLDGALLYNRSVDGGATWNGWLILPGMDYGFYMGFGGDTYAWAEPKGDTLCFVVGDKWMDEFIMKSTDKGISWSKTVIWACPFNKWTGGDSTGNFYCSDGSSAVALDQGGHAHVVFGRQEEGGDPTGYKFYYPFTDGLIYWNESMPTLPVSLDYDSLFNAGNLIGWVQDTNVFHESSWSLPYYEQSLSSMPSIIIDGAGNNLFVFFSMVTEDKDSFNYLLRKIYCRTWQDGAWNVTFFPLTDDPWYTGKECVFPMTAPSCDDKLYLQFMCDTIGGSRVRTPGMIGTWGYTENHIILLTPEKQSLIHTGIREEKNEPSFSVSQNDPNPFSGATRFAVSVKKETEITVSVTSVEGRQLISLPVERLMPGQHTVILDCSALSPGIYLYSVKARNEVITNKMVVF